MWRSTGEAILNGEADANLINAIADKLQLDCVKLIRSAKKVWYPALLEIVGLKQISSTYCDMIVNAYVVWDMVSRNAWIFDSGIDAEPILGFIEEENSRWMLFFSLIPIAIMFILGCFTEKTGDPKVYVHQLELLDDCEPVEEGFQYFDGFTFTRSQTHSRAFSRWFTYLVDGLEKPVAVVGDAIFAGSMGGGNGFL